MNIPKHVAIIPDGNRRWAKERGLPAFEGHRIAAEKTLPDLIKRLKELGVKYFTFWALSTENLTKRSPKELQGLFDLTRLYLRNQVKKFKKNKVQIKTIGDLSKLPKDIQELINKAVKETSNFNKLTVMFAVNYGGRDEIVRAINKYQNSKVKSQNLTKEDFNKYLDTSGVPDPDLIIRTGGEKRLSGFMQWQSEYSELYFSDLYFPDFKENELEKAVQDYSTRKRRFGK